MSHEGFLSAFQISNLLSFPGRRKPLFPRHPNSLGLGMPGRSTSLLRRSLDVKGFCFFCLRPCLCVKKFEDGKTYMHLVANKRNNNTLIIHICMLDIKRKKLDI